MRSENVLAETCLAQGREGLRFESLPDSEDEPRLTTVFGSLLEGGERVALRNGMAAIGCPMSGGRFLIGRLVAAGEERRLLGLILPEAAYARLVAGGLWRCLDAEWLWESPAFGTGLPLPVPAAAVEPPSPNPELSAIRDQVLMLREGVGVSIVGGDATRTVLRVLRRFSDAEVATVAWSIGVDPPPEAVRLAAAGPLPDGSRWVPPQRHPSASPAALPAVAKVVRGGVPTAMVVFAGALAAVAVLIATTLWIARGEVSHGPDGGTEVEVRPS
ncbi:MAG: hypothetical protein ACYTFH_03195 [Planctomycetota bacterium]|jgi:hypothetical protein